MITTKTQNKASVENSAIKMKETFGPLLTEGIPFYLTRGLAEQDIDALYIIAYNLYSEKKYKEALQLFEIIAFYNHFDKRGWIGSAACYQLFQRYDEALVCYSHASLIDLQDPLPLLHAVECYIALKRYPEARSAVEVLLTLTEKNSKFANLTKWATKVKEVL